MQIEKTLEGYWKAEGTGPVRKIIVEGETETEAVKAYISTYCNQVYRVIYEHPLGPLR